MKKLIIVTLALFVFTTTSAYAAGSHSHGGGHSHDHHSTVSKAQLLVNAQKVVKKIVSKGKLDPSWTDIEPTKAEQNDTPDTTEWVVTFENPAITDDAKKTLYVFMDLKGRYIAANYTGN